MKDDRVKETDLGLVMFRPLVSIHHLGRESHIVEHSLQLLRELVAARCMEVGPLTCVKLR